MTENNCSLIGYQALICPNCDADSKMGQDVIKDATTIFNEVQKRSCQYGIRISTLTQHDMSLTMNFLHR